MDRNEEIDLISALLKENVLETEKIVYLVQEEWWNEWLAYKNGGPRPSRMKNYEMLYGFEIIHSNTHMINKEAWEVLREAFDGRPEIEIFVFEKVPDYNPINVYIKLPDKSRSEMFLLSSHLTPNDFFEYVSWKKNLRLQNPALYEDDSKLHPDIQFSEQNIKKGSKMTLKSLPPEIPESKPLVANNIQIGKAKVAHFSDEQYPIENERSHADERLNAEERLPAKERILEIISNCEQGEKISLEIKPISEKMTEWWRKYEGKVPNAGIFFPEEEFIELKSVNNYHIQTYRFHNPNPIGIIVCLHGMYSETNECSHVAKKFHEEGFTVIGLDQEGHGKSEGPKGTILSLENYAKDTENFIIKAKSLYPAKAPLFLMGLSMGGAIAVLVSIARPDLVNGMLLFAPALGVSPDFEPFLQKIVRCLNCCCGCLRLKEFDSTFVCRNKDYADFYRANPWNYNGKMNVKTAVAMLDGLDNLHSKLHNVCIPLILFQGNSDKIVDPRENKEFVENCRSSDKEIVVYEEMYHSIYHEPEIFEIMEKCVRWLYERVGNNAGDNEIL